MSAQSERVRIDLAREIIIGFCLVPEFRIACEAAFMPTLRQALVSCSAARDVGIALRKADGKPGPP